MLLNFFRDIKIGFLEEKAQKLLSEIVSAIEMESLSGNLSSDLLGDVNSSLDKLLEYKEAYVQLKEKFKHDKKTQLKVATDWYDLNKMLNELFTHKATSQENYLQTRSKEIIERFNSLLKE